MKNKKLTLTIASALVLFIVLGFMYSHNRYNEKQRINAVSDSILKSINMEEKVWISFDHDNVIVNSAKVSTTPVTKQLRDATFGKLTIESCNRPDTKSWHCNNKDSISMFISNLHGMTGFKYLTLSKEEKKLLNLDGEKDLYLKLRMNTKPNNKTIINALLEAFYEMTPKLSGAVAIVANDGMTTINCVNLASCEYRTYHLVQKIESLQSEMDPEQLDSFKEEYKTYEYYDKLAHDIGLMAFDLGLFDSK